LIRALDALAAHDVHGREYGTRPLQSGAQGGPMTSPAAVPLALWLAAAPAPAPPPDYAKALAGKRLVMEETACAGLAFTGKDVVEMYAELECSRGWEPTVEGRVRWVAPDVFVVIATKRDDEKCPPRNWVYKVESLTAKTVRLRDVWTGWGRLDDSVVDYKLIPADAPPGRR
jgi:hypothetical protein